MPGLLKTGAALALTCLGLAQSPQLAQAQTTKPPVLKLGVPLLGPAPKSDVGKPYICWAPGTSAATIAAFERRRIDKGIATSLTPSPYRLFGQRWSTTATNGSGLKQGQPTTLTYSFVPDGTAVGGFADEPAAPSNLQARLNTIYGNKTTWLGLFDKVVKALGAQSGLTYVYEPNDDGAVFGTASSGLKGTRGDIRVSGHRVDGNSGILAYNFAPDFGDMVIDTADNFFENRGGNDLGFRNTITHEFGHGVGLDHTCPTNETKLMEPFISLKFDGPQFDDIRGLQRLYGDKSEDNDTGATATALGALGDGTVDPAAGKILSIDDGTNETSKGDEDFYSFSILPNKSLSISVSPLGEAYLEGPQNADDSCTAGTQLDPKLINDLGFELLKDDGTGNFVSVGTTNSSALGAPEVLSATNFPTGGNFRVRVFGGPVKDLQTYSMRLVVGPPVVEPTPTAGPTPTPGPTPGPTATPAPQPTPIRPIIDLNGANADGSTGQDSAEANGIDNTSRYFYRINGAASGGAQRITPPQTIVLSDISGNNIPEEDRGKAIREARVHLTPENGRRGTAPDNPNANGVNDQEVLSIPAAVLQSINGGGGNLSVSYSNASQTLTIKGGTDNLDSNRRNYQIALRNVNYENKRPNPNLFDTDPGGNLVDRILTYVVDTDNENNNNQDSRFGQFDGPGSNPLQSKPAILMLRFAADTTNTPPTVAVDITATNPAPNGFSTEVLTNSVLTAIPTSTSVDSSGNPTPAGNDVDGDRVTYSYQWSVNGTALPQERGKTLDLAKNGNGSRDDVISVQVTATDTPNANSTGGAATATATASVTVGNTAPIAQNVAFSVNPGETARVLLTATDADDTDTLFTFTQTSNPTKGTATIEINSDGRGVLVYTANPNTNGLDTVSFTASDMTTFQPAPNQTVVRSAAKTSDTAVARITITGVTTTPTPGPTPTPDPNRPPAGADTSVNAQREVPVVKVLTISDPDANDTYATLNVVRVSGPRKGTGEIRKDGDGIWKLFYKASGLYQGNDEVRFVVVDKKGAKSKDAVITINLFNTKPTARSTKMQVAAGGSASVGLFGQDIDRDALTFKRVGGPSKGTGEIRKDENGNFRFYYQNSPVAIGNDQVQFVAIDGQPGGVSEIVTIDITVVGIFNRAPSAQNVSGATTSGTPVAVAVSGTDPDEGDVLTFKRVGGPSNGTGEISLDADGTYKIFYTPRPGFVGTETIRYVALDQKNRPSAPANITITVTASAPGAIRSGPATSAGSS